MDSLDTFFESQLNRITDRLSTETASEKWIRKTHRRRQSDGIQQLEFEKGIGAICNSIGPSRPTLSQLDQDPT